MLARCPLVKASVHQIRANLLFEQEQFEDALAEYVAALEYNPDDFVSRENFEYCLHRLLPAWHFRMLNDHERNRSYEIAIRGLLSRLQNARAIDVGCGTGLLTAMAFSANYTSVTSIDDSPFFVGMTKTILSKNKMPVGSVFPVDSYHFSSHSGPFNVLIAELFDCALLGEHFLSVLSDLHERNVLTNDDLRIIPTRASIHIGLYESPLLRTANYWVDSRRCIALVRESSPSGYTSFPLQNLYSEHLKLLALRRNAASIDFTNIALVEEMLDGQWSQVVRFNADSKPMRIDFIAVWFTLHLTDEVSVDTGPERSGGCWHQAVYPICEQALSWKDPKCEIRCCTGGSTEKGEYLSVRLIGGRPVPIAEQIRTVSSASIARMHRQDYQHLFLNNWHPPSVLLTDCPMGIFLSGYGERLVVSSRESDGYRLIKSLGEPFRLNAIDEAREDWLQDLKRKLRSRHIILVYEPCDQSGQIQRNLWRNVQLVKSAYRIDKFVPNQFSLLGFLAESSSVRNDVCVNETISEKFSIQHEVNKFSPRRVYDIDCMAYPFRQLSEQLELCSSDQFQLVKETKLINFKVTSDGIFDVMFYFFRLHMEDGTYVDTLLPLACQSGFRIAGLRNPGTSIPVAKDDIVQCKLSRDDHFLEAEFVVLTKEAADASL